MTNVIIALSFLVFFIVIIGVYGLKYIDSVTSPWSAFITSSIYMKSFVIGSIGFVLLFSILYVKSPYNLPAIGYNSSEYTDLVDVGDGIVVVGRTRYSASPKDKPNHSYDMTRAYIVKYDYEGHIIWEDVYYLEDDVELRTIFYNVTYNQETQQLLVSGQLGGYYDGYNFIQITYNEDGNIVNETKIPYATHSAIPVLNSDIGTIEINYTIDENNRDQYQLEITFEDTKNNRYNISYDTIEMERTTEFNDHEPIITVVYQDNDVIVIGITVFDLRDNLKFNQLYVYDYELNLLDTIDLEGAIIPGNIVLHENQYYMLSSNGIYRESYLSKLDNDFTITQSIQIQSDYDYFVARDILFEDNHIYIGGNEYETMTKEGFTEYFSGLIVEYDTNLNKIKTKHLQQGVGLNSFIFVGDNIYTVGLYNTSISPMIASKDNPWCGVLTKYTTENRNYVLAFTHRMDR